MTTSEEQNEEMGEPNGVFSGGKKLSEELPSKREMRRFILFLSIFLDFYLFTFSVAGNYGLSDNYLMTGTALKS